MSFEQTRPEIPPSMLQIIDPEPLETVALEDLIAQEALSLQPKLPSGPLVLSKSVKQLLPALQIQSPHYMTAHIHRFPYLITAGDTLRLPFHMSGVNPGDVLRLNRVSLLGSRDYTLKAGTTRAETYDGKPSKNTQYLDERLFECRACVMGVESGPMFSKKKTKRRNRMVKTVHSKHRYTVLKIVEVKVKSLEELQAMGIRLLLESGYDAEGAEIRDVREAETVQNP
jgi:large subunit ribosomal protein L21